MKNYQFSFIILITLILASCTPAVHLTQPLREQIEKNKIDLKNIQFYNDRKIVLRRELTSDEVAVNEGKVKFENGIYVNEVIIRKKTPGICTFFSDSTIMVSFEEGKGKELTFGMQRVVYPENTVVYQIMARQWKDDYGKLTYNDKVYYITPRGSEARLLLSKDELSRTSFEKHVVKGLKLDKTQ